MPARRYNPYWVFPQQGDPLPHIGCGFRRVRVCVGPKAVWVKPLDESSDLIDRLTHKEWAGVPHLEWQMGQSVGDVVLALRHYDAPVTRAETAYKKVLKRVRRKVRK